MSALAAKPSPEEIERRRRAKRAERAANPKKKVVQQQTQKKQRDPAEEAKALREFRIAPLIDAGANLQSRGSYDDVVRQLRRASQAGVAAVVLTGCDVDGSTAGKDFCERWASEGSTLQLGFTAGVHPHDASKFTEDTLQKLEALATSPFCVALGECGLDYDRMFSPRDVQLAAFRAQCGLAKRLGRSLFVHVREKEAGEAAEVMWGCKRPCGTAILEIWRRSQEMMQRRRRPISARSREIESRPGEIAPGSHLWSGVGSRTGFSADT